MICKVINNNNNNNIVATSPDILCSLRKSMQLWTIYRVHIMPYIYIYISVTATYVIYIYIYIRNVLVCESAMLVALHI